MTSDAAETIGILLHHQALCRELLGLVERESRELQPSLAPAPSAAKASARAPGSTTFDFYQRRRRLLPQLDASMLALKRQRAWWQRLDAETRRGHPEVDTLIRANQDLIMKIVVMDRENEKARLRLGMLPPSHWPAPQAQRPHYVASLYQRHTPSQPGS